MYLDNTCNISQTSFAIKFKPEFSSGVLILLGVLMALLALITVLGNALVILAFVVDKNLRYRSNYFFLNLAISDVAVGAFSIPVYIPYILTGTWHLGKVFCKLWLIVDSLMCSASSFNIVLISYDRFLSVSNAVYYRSHQTMTSKAVVLLVAIWVFAFLLDGPAIIIWEYVVACSSMRDGECYPEFISNWYISMCISALGSFIPLFFVAYFNLRIFQTIQKHKRNSSVQLSNSPKGKRQPWRLCTLLKKRMPSPDLETKDSVSASSGIQNQSLALDSSNLSQIHSIISENDDLGSYRKKTQSKPQRHKNIAKPLSIIVCIFTICWAPYSFLTLIRVACSGTCVSDSLHEATFWLLWINSSVNPFLYSLYHVKFRRAFIKMLCPQKLVGLSQSSSS
ncbi:histamine H3 receptor-like [Alligator sinensis]|uniref:Histamine H3 receptor-like n=1 Tax=Alligator sinensis TaxID=38654 RepID=A0A3Q0HHS5_ALLSI|nr:histamine H3 receptor-like [Alligator sinensis]